MYENIDLKVNNSNFCYKIRARTVGTSSGGYIECLTFNSVITKIFGSGEENENCPVIRIDSFGAVKLYLPNTAQPYKVAVSIEQL